MYRKIKQGRTLIIGPDLKLSFYDLTKQLNQVFKHIWKHSANTAAYIVHSPTICYDFSAQCSFHGSPPSGLGKAGDPQHLNNRLLYYSNLNS